MKLFQSEEEVNEFLGIQTVAESDLSWVQPKNQKAVLAANKLFNIHEAHNKANGFVADWEDSDQYKYQVYKGIEADEDKPSGFGFSLTSSDFWFTATFVGSRLVVGSSTEALHIGNTFSHLYEDLFLIDK